MKEVCILDKFTGLREKYPEFIYHSYNITDEGFSFRFTIGGYEFLPGWKWNGLKIPEGMPVGERSASFPFRLRIPGFRHRFRESGAADLQ